MIKTFLYSLLLSFLPLFTAAGDINVCCQERAYGGIIADISTGRNVQNRLYNGKELDRTNNLWWYDFVARPYDPTRGQFTGPDMLAEKYYAWNPFTFCLNNPLRYEDPDGNSAWKRGLKFVYGIGKAVAKDGLKSLGNAATYTSAFVDVKENVETIFSNDASLGERVGAGLSIASEILPVSIKDVKDAGKAISFNKNIKSNIKVGGRNKNNLHPSKEAKGPHTSFKTDKDGNITNYETFEVEPRNPTTGFKPVKRVDVVGKTHGDIPTPHVHEKGIVRPAKKEELPKKGK